MSLWKDIRFVQGNLDAGPTSLTPEGRCLYEELIDKFELARHAYSDLQSAQRHLRELRREELDWRFLSMTEKEYDTDAQNQLSSCMERLNGAQTEEYWCKRVLQEVLRECRRTIREMERLGSRNSVRRNRWLMPREVANHQS